MAKTRNNQAPQSQAALGKACEKVIPDQSGVNLLQTSVEKWPVPYDQNKVRNVLLQQFQAFQTQLEHQTSDAPSGGGHVSGREAGKGRAHSGTVTPSSNQDWRWFVSRPLIDIFISIDEEAKSLDTTSSERNDRAAANVTSFFFFFRSVATVNDRAAENVSTMFSSYGRLSTAFINEERTLLCTEGPRVASGWKTPLFPKLGRFSITQCPNCLTEIPKQESVWDVGRQV